MGSKCCVTANPDIVSKDTICILNEQNPSFYEFIEGIEFVPPYLNIFFSADFYFKVLKGVPFNSFFCNQNLKDDEYLVGIRLLLKNTNKSNLFNCEQKFKPARISEILHIFKNVQSIIQEYLNIIDSRNKKLKKGSPKIFSIYIHLVYSYIKLLDNGQPWWELSNIDHFNILKNELIAVFSAIQPSFLSISITQSKVSLSPKSRRTPNSSKENSGELAYSDPLMEKKKKFIVSSLRNKLKKGIKPSLDSIEEEIIEKRRKDNLLKLTSLSQQMKSNNMNLQEKDEMKMEESLENQNFNSLL